MGKTSNYDIFNSVRKNSTEINFVLVGSSPPVLSSPPLSKNLDPEWVKNKNKDPKGALLLPFIGTSPKEEL